MFQKIKNYPYYQLLKQLRDIRVVGLIAFGVIVLLVSWSGVSVIETNYNLEKQVAILQQQNDVQQLENNNLKLKNEYYNTDQYLELQARRQFGKAAPGETLVLVPKTVALAHTIDIKPVADSTTQPQKPQPAYQRNLRAWWDFFLHRQSSE